MAWACRQRAVPCAAAAKGRRNAAVTARRRKSTGSNAGMRGRTRRLKAVSEAYIDCLRLDQYDRHPFIAPNGWIAPPRDLSAKGFVFAVFDADDALEFIGFSKDIRNSLRNVYFRQPDKCHSYRFVDLPELDQKQMSIIRNTWLLQEGDRVPPGHGEDKNFWLKPPCGDQAAADAHLQKLRDNGLVEEMEIDAAKLSDEGVMELLPSKHALTPQEIEEKEKQEAYDEANTFTVSETFGERKKQIDFELYIALSFKTNGGWMYDVDITMDETTTSHRITVSDFFLEIVNVEASEMLKRTFLYLYGNKAVRSTDRNSPNDIKDFPINYFSMNQVDQLYPGFGDMFPEGRVPRPDELWGFKRNTVSGAVLNEDKPLKGMPLLGPEHAPDTEFNTNTQAARGTSPHIISPMEEIGVEVELESSVGSDGEPSQSSSSSSSKSEVA